MSEIENPEEMYSLARKGLGVIIFLAFPLMIVGGVIPVGVWMMAIIPLRYDFLKSPKITMLVYIGLYILAVVVAMGVEETPYEFHLLSRS
ncbi:MAG: hypothetical protein V7744_20630 [Pseudomonadales bacterium]